MATTEAVPATTTASPSSSNNVAESMEGKSAKELSAMGIRAYWVRKYADAVAYLSRSSEMLVEEHKDDKHDSLGDVYLYYGRSLLEVAREDGDPLGEAVPKEVGVEEELSDEEDDDEEADEQCERDEDDEEVEGKVKEGGEEDKTEEEKKADISINGEAATSKAGDGEEAKKEGEGEDEEGGDDDEEEEGEGDGEAGEDAGEGTSGEKIEEDEPSDLQLAWEVLELAKIIFERRGDDGRECLADCLVALGEVSLESENFDSAITDIQAGLDIQKTLFTESKDMRRLAETYYKLGMALAANNRIDDGVAMYQSTLDVLDGRLKVLEAKTEPGTSDADEIRDIKNLVPELQDKIADLRSYKEEAAAQRKVDEEPAFVSSPEKKANNITHLVRRKRKLDDVVEEASTNAAAGSSEAKKPAL